MNYCGRGMPNMKTWDSGLNAEDGLAGDAEVRVRYADTDGMGWVYYANYLCYFEVGRTELMRTVWRAYRDVEAGGLILPVVETGCTYRMGARYDDVLRVHTRLSLPSKVRLRFDYHISRDADQAGIADGFTVHCFVNRAGRPVPIPADLRALAGR